MKTIFRSTVAAVAIIMAVSCGNNASKEQAVTANEAPSVSVEQVSVREVPQLATYTSTVQAYVKNNIAPQM